MVRAETAHEVDEARAAYQETPLERLDRLGATGPGFIAIHVVHPARGDIERLATQGCHVVHCPGSNMKLASGIAPVADFVARGINVALGTDGAASNNRLDLLSELRLASLLAKVVTGDASALPARTALRMATLNGAAALGLEARIGSLVPGKDADVAAICIDDVETLPVYDPVSHLANAAGREHVTDVWVAGERVVEDRRLTRVDATTVTSRARVWQDRILAAGLTPVIAHPERTEAVLEDPSLADDLAARGWMLQVNATSLIGRHGPELPPQRFEHVAVEPPRRPLEARGVDQVRLADGAHPDRQTGAPPDERTGCSRVVEVDVREEQVADVLQLEPSFGEACLQRLDRR